VLPPFPAEFLPQSSPCRPNVNRNGHNRTQISKNILYSIGIYLIFFAAAFVGHFFFFSLEWEIWGKPVIIAEFLIATAIVVFIWAKSFSKHSQTGQERQ